MLSLTANARTLAFRIDNKSARLSLTIGFRRDIFPVGSLSFVLDLAFSLPASAFCGRLLLRLLRGFFFPFIVNCLAQ